MTRLCLCRSQDSGYETRVGRSEGWVVVGREVGGDTDRMGVHWSGDGGGAGVGSAWVVICVSLV